MASLAFTVPYVRRSPVQMPRRDLVLGMADSLWLTVTIIDHDDVCAQGIDLSGPSPPVLQMLVWPDAYVWRSWDYGGVAYGPRSVLWTGTGTPSDAIGAFDVVAPAATMSSWPRRCLYALQLGWDDGVGCSMLAEGGLHLVRSS